MKFSQELERSLNACDLNGIRAALIGYLDIGSDSNVVLVADEVNNQLKSSGMELFDPDDGRNVTSSASMPREALRSIKAALRLNFSKEKIRKGAELKWQVENSDERSDGSRMVTASKVFDVSAPQSAQPAGTKNNDEEIVVPAELREAVFRGETSSVKSILIGCLDVFDKTEVLAPGESTEVEIEISKEHMKAYDAFGKGTYIVDEGSYYFAAGKDAHDALNNILAAQGYTEADGMTAEGDASLAASCEQETFDAKTYAVGSTGASIENQFDDASYAHYEPSFTYLTRSDWVGTWPQPLGETYVGESNAGYWTMEASDEIAQGLVTPNAADDPGAKMPVTGAANGLTLASLIGVDFDSEYWDMLLDQMTAEEMMDLVGNAGFGTPLVQSVNKPATTEKDGPAGISSTLIGGVGCFGYPIAMVFASSWNLELQEEYGYYYGNDAILSRVSGIYAPSINMHRTPFSGRNFEYYSEDSFQSGMFAATFIRSVKEKGVYCYTKHFALNDQELNRDTAATFATEQTIREIYLRPFELAVRIGGSNGMMVSKNRIGTVWTGVNKNLLTDVLRGEWGFEGAVITDGLHVYSEEFNSKTALDAGLDAYLCTTKGAWEIPGYQNNASVVEDLREASHRILYNIANSLAMNNIGASTRVVPVMPPWQIALFVADAVLGVIVAVGAVFLVRGIYKAWREER